MMDDPTSAEVMRAAALRLRDAVNPYAVARLIDGTFVAVCRAHDEPAIVCENCWHFEVGDEKIAALVVALLNARGPLSAWLKVAAVAVDPTVPQRLRELAHSHAPWLATARAISGGEHG